MLELWNDLRGLFGSPGPTIAKQMEKKRWLAAFILILLAASILTYLSYPITKTEQAKFIRDSEMANSLNEEELAGLDKFTPAQRIIGALYQLPLSAFMLLLAAFFIYLFFKVAGCEGYFIHYFSAVAFASVLDMFLGGILKTVLVLAKKSMVMHTNLTIFFPNLEIKNLSFHLLSQFDFFFIWYLLALALGIACFAKISPKKSMAIAALYFIFKSLVIISISFFTMKLMNM